MPRRKYALERGGPKRLQLRWGWRLKDFEVALDGQAWRLDRAAVLAGATITIPGGSSLFVRSVRRRWWSVALRDELRVELDGVPVPGSDGHPLAIGRRAASVIALFGLLRVLFVGLWAVFSAADGRAVDPLAAITTASGAIQIVLAVLAGFGLRLPVLLAAGLLTLELVAAVALAGARSSGLGFVVQVLVIVHLHGAWKRMRPRTATPSLATVFE